MESRSSANKISGMAAFIMDSCSCIMYRVKKQLVPWHPDDGLPALWHIVCLVSVKALIHTCKSTKSASHTPTETQTQTFRHCTHHVYKTINPAISGGIKKCICLAAVMRNQIPFLYTRTCSSGCESWLPRGDLTIRDPINTLHTAEQSISLSLSSCPTGRAFLRLLGKMYAVLQPLPTGLKQGGSTGV